MPRLKGISLGQDVAGQIRQGVTPQVSPVGRATRELGRSIAGFGADIQKREEQSEISDITAKMAQYHAEQTNVWAETRRAVKTKDIGELSSTFMKTFQTGLDGIGEDLSTRGGQSYFKRASAQLSGQFLKTTFAGQAHLAGVKSVEDYTKSQAARGATLLKEPSDYNYVIEQHKQQIEQLIIGGGLSREQGFEFLTRGELVLTRDAIRGWAHNDASDTRKRLQAGEWDQRGITGQVKKQMFGEIDNIERATRLEAARLKSAEAEALKEKRVARNNELFDQLYSEGGLSTDTILDDPILAPQGMGSKKEWFAMIETFSQNKFKIDPAEQGRLFELIHLADGEEGKITDERQLNEFFPKLGRDSFNFLRTEIQGNKTLEGKLANQNKKTIISAAKSDITGSNRALGFIDPIGNEVYRNYMLEVNRRFLEGKRAGVSDADLTTNRNSPHFLGSIARDYNRNLEERLKTTINMLDPSPITPAGEPIPIPSDQIKTPQIRPGESAKAFFKRHPEAFNSMMKESLE